MTMIAAPQAADSASQILSWDATTVCRRWSITPFELNEFVRATNFPLSWTL